MINCIVLDVINYIVLDVINCDTALVFIFYYSKIYI